MKQKVANYTIIIEKEYRTGTKKVCYSAYVPILGVAADADSLEEVQDAIKKLVDFHLESLAEEGEENVSISKVLARVGNETHRCRNQHGSDRAPEQIRRVDPCNALSC